MFREAPYHLREVFLLADEGQIAGILHELLAEYPHLMLGSYPYFDNRDYSIKLTLESKDRDYVDRAFESLLQKLAAIRLEPVKVSPL
jgi:hypothetical protein